MDGRDTLNIPEYERLTTMLPADQLKDWSQSNVLFPRVVLVEHRAGVGVYSASVLI